MKEFAGISPEDFTKLRLIAEMLFNLANHDRVPHAKQIAESISGTAAKDLAEALLFVGQPPFPTI